MHQTFGGSGAQLHASFEKECRIEGKKWQGTPKQNFIVPENVQHEFSVNDTTCGIFMNSSMWAACTCMRIKINSKTWMTKRSKKYSPRRQTKSCNRKDCPEDMNSRTEPVEGVKQFTPKVCVSSRILCCVVIKSTHNILNQPEFGNKTESQFGLNSRVQRFLQHRR